MIPPNNQNASLDLLLHRRRKGGQGAHGSPHYLEVGGPGGAKRAWFPLQQLCARHVTIKRVALCRYKIWPPHFLEDSYADVLAENDQIIHYFISAAAAAAASALNGQHRKRLKLQPRYSHQSPSFVRACVPCLFKSSCNTLLHYTSLKYLQRPFL